MKRHALFFVAAMLMSQIAWAAPKIKQVEPLCWWTNMETPLTVMFHGQDLADAEVSIFSIIS